MKKKWYIILIAIILLLLFVIFYLLFIKERQFTITFDSSGGSEISNIEVKNGEIIKLPKVPEKEGYTFAYWTNEKGNVITSGTKVTDNITLKAKWIKKDAKTITMQFNDEDGNKISDVVIEKGEIIVLPVSPTKEGYTFIGWINEDGKFITENIIVNKNIILKALWIKNDVETKTITFDTDGGSKVNSIIVENGKVILLPVNPTKDGFVFRGWVDQNGNSITKDTIVSDNITIKAVWKEPYTCPSSCTPIGDGSKCTREKTTKMITIYTCPSGTILYDTWYGSGSYCIDLSTKVDGNIRQCDTWEAAEVDYKDSNGKSWCVKTVSKKSSKGCPSGYTKSGSICKKTEKISCTAN